MFAVGEGLEQHPSYTDKSTFLVIVTYIVT